MKKIFAFLVILLFMGTMLPTSTGNIIMGVDQQDETVSIFQTVNTTEIIHTFHLQDESFVQLVQYTCKIRQDIIEYKLKISDNYFIDALDFCDDNNTFFTSTYHLPVYFLIKFSVDGNITGVKYFGDSTISKLIPINIMNENNNEIKILYQRFNLQWAYDGKSVWEDQLGFDSTTYYPDLFINSSSNLTNPLFDAALPKMAILSLDTNLSITNINNITNLFYNPPKNIGSAFLADDKLIISRDIYNHMEFSSWYSNTSNMTYSQEFGQSDQFGYAISIFDLEMNNSMHRMYPLTDYRSEFNIFDDKIYVHQSNQFGFTHDSCFVDILNISTLTLVTKISNSECGKMRMLAGSLNYSGGFGLFSNNSLYIYDEAGLLLNIFQNNKLFSFVSMFDGQILISSSNPALNSVQLTSINPTGTHLWNKTIPIPMNANHVSLFSSDLSYTIRFGNIAATYLIDPSPGPIYFIGHDSMNYSNSLGSIDLVYKFSPLDSDMDGVYDLWDNCDKFSNVNQTDSDGDNIGDKCDLDYINLDNETETNTLPNTNSTSNSSANNSSNNTNSLNETTQENNTNISNNDNNNSETIEETELTNNSNPTEEDTANEEKTDGGQSSSEELTSKNFNDRTLMAILGLVLVAFAIILITSQLSQRP